MTSGLPRLAEVSDLRAWPEVVVENAEVSAAEAVLDRASAVVRRAARATFTVIGDDDVIALDPARPDEARQITVAAAARFWNNPAGATMRVKGPFTDQFSQAIEAGVYLTASEKDEAAELVAGRRTYGGLGVIATTKADPSGTTGYVPVAGSFDAEGRQVEFPWYGAE